MSNSDPGHLADKEIAPNIRGVKLDSKKSRFTQEIQKKEEFQEQAQKTFNKSQEKKMEAFELTKQFLEIFRKKVLPENKGPMEKEIEIEVLSKLVQWGLDANNDSDELEGAGSMGIITLLLKIVLVIRDKNNILSYTTNQLEDKVKSLELRLKALERTE